MTREEYIRTCSTEKLAWLIYQIAVYDELEDIIRNAEVIDPSTDGTSGFNAVLEWLRGNPGGCK